ncbi:hypothetical protein FE257_006966 [Aspergillus nanangensis]|uniref:Fungal N-terminal domain-containing protein n=1 Tax=Aspergillus nanangensis TaxID=2582783 RepID=A0AAD4CNR7_ASPNN|nr:hypothetical protein FE257_006966 [Aspergillus nanangensis]
MSFGFSVGDFVTVTALACQIYAACKDSTDELQALSTEVSSLRFLLEKTSENMTQYDLSAEDMRKADNIRAGCQDVLEEIQQLVETYQAATERKRRIFLKMRWAFKDRSGVRARLTGSVMMLTAFNTNLINSAHIRTERKLESILHTCQTPETAVAPRWGHKYDSVTASGRSIQLNGNISASHGGVAADDGHHLYTRVMATGLSRQLNGNIRGPMVLQL